MLPAFAELRAGQTGPDNPSPINLVLVHGSQNAEFAFLRAYHDPIDLKKFIEVGSNIMNVIHEIEPAEAEEIREVEPELKAHVERAKSSGA